MWTIEVEKDKTCIPAYGSAFWAGSMDQLYGPGPWTPSWVSYLFSKKTDENNNASFTQNALEIFISF